MRILKETFIDITESVLTIINSFTRNVHIASKYLRNIVVWLCPFVLLLLGAYVLIFYVFGSEFDHYIQFLRVIVWPVTILIALFFFRKVATYMFFSMKEFNFFGAKGELKDITKVIEERVESRIREEKEEEMRSNKIKSVERKLQKANASTENAKTKADENYELARSIFKDFKELSESHERVSKELNELRERESARAERMRLGMEQFRRRREEREFESSRESNESGSDDAGTPVISHVREKKYE